METNSPKQNNSSNNNTTTTNLSINSHNNNDTNHSSPITAAASSSSSSSSTSSTSSTCSTSSSYNNSSSIIVETTKKLDFSPTTSSSGKRIGCSHYKRRCLFVTPCCNKLYQCRYCHDENESHYFNRRTVSELICIECNTRQRVKAECEKCGVRFGKYTCLICNLFDDEEKNQYHCYDCGICRIGGRDRFFHCAVCNMCLPIQLKIDGHRCVENVSRSNCPVCLEDIHTSRIPCHIPECGHLLHRTCFQELLSSGHYACPTCQTSMMDMKTLWDYLDAEVLATTMPKEYENYLVDILCKDCHKVSKVKFHIVGLKCLHCGGYNTCRTKGQDATPNENGNSNSNGTTGGGGGGGSKFVPSSHHRSSHGNDEA